jgi:hypothetical protein
MYNLKLEFAILCFTNEHIFSVYYFSPQIFLCCNTLNYSKPPSFWQSIEDWERETESWLGMAFQEIDVEHLQKEVAVFFKSATIARKILPPGNPVPGIFFEKVLQFKHVLPVVQALRNPALKDRHWQRIYQVLHMRGADSDAAGVLPVGGKADKDAAKKDGGKDGSGGKDEGSSGKQDGGKDNKNKDSGNKDVDMSDQSEWPVV